MGTQKQSSPDKVEKILEDYGDVFADIINVLVYHGEEVVRSENLADGPTASLFKAAEGNWGQKGRDVIKMDVRNHIAYALYGLENQTAVNYVMPVRSMGYDYASYNPLRAGKPTVSTVRMIARALFNCRYKFDYHLQM